MGQYDVVFCTHQRSSSAVPAMLAAHVAGLPSATFVHSWDNLPKGRMAVCPDHYLVWSERMKGEMERFYPDVPGNKVHIVGTPQFEIHTDRGRLLTKEEFCRQRGLQQDKPIICFSGDDLSTSPHDPLYLRDVADSLRNSVSGPQPQLVFRRCPADTSSRYDHVLDAYPEILVFEPLWTKPDNGDWQQVLPQDEDQTQLANLAAHGDLVVNVGSTVALDFAIHGKPAIFLAYDQESARNADWSVDQIYSLPHFSLIHETNPVHWVTHRKSLRVEIQLALDNPHQKSSARKACIDELTRHPIHEASERCVAALQRVANRGIRPRTTFRG